MKCVYFPSSKTIENHVNVDCQKHTFLHPKSVDGQSYDYKSLIDSITVAPSGSEKEEDHDIIAAILHSLTTPGPGSWIPKLSNTVVTSFSQSASSLVTISSSNDDEKGAEASLTNLEDIQEVADSTILRINTIHPQENIIGDPSSGVRTRNQLAGSINALIAEIRESGIQNEVFHSCFLSQVEPSNVAKVLEDASWVEAMQEELQQFTKLGVWHLVDLPKNSKEPCGTKWVFKCKKDDRGVIVRNKARLVVQGFSQIVGIDFNEVYAPVARIKAIRIFLAFAAYHGFKVYQMDVKSAFLNGTNREEVYVKQPPSFYDPDFPNRVYNTNDSLCKEFERVMKTKFEMSSMGEMGFFLGLQVQQSTKGIFSHQTKYVSDILARFKICDVRIPSTPIQVSHGLGPDEYGENIDPTLFRAMIGSLMYLTASRPDIMFVVCVCARYQATPKASQMIAVKRIFAYLKGNPDLGIWYPNDNKFELSAYSDSDYGGCKINFKSTTAGCQFLGDRLVSWQCKKQTSDLSAVKIILFVLMICIDMAQFKSDGEHNVYAFLDASARWRPHFLGIFDFMRRSRIYYAATCECTPYKDLLVMFWTSAQVDCSVEPSVIRARFLQTDVIISEGDVRLVLRLNDQADFLTEFDEANLIALLRRIKYDGQLYVPWYLKANLSPPYKYLMHVIIKCFGNRTREQEEFDLKVLSFFAALVLNRKFNFSGWIFNYMKENILTKQVKSIMYPRFIQMILNDLHPNLPKNQNAILIMKHMNQIAVGKLPIYQKRKGNNVPPPVKRLIGHLANPDYIAPADGAAKHPDSSDDELEYNDNGYPIEIAENEEEIPEVQANQEPIQQQHVPVQQQQPEPVVHENIVEPEAVNLQDDDMTADADMSKGDDASASSSETDSDSGDYITILHNTREIPVKRGSKAHVAYLKSQTQYTSLYESRTKQVEDNDDDPLYTPVMEEPVAKSKPVDKAKLQWWLLASALNEWLGLIFLSSTTASSSATASSTAAATRSTISSADLKLAIHQTRLDALESTNRQHADEIRGLQRVTAQVDCSVEPSVIRARVLQTDVIISEGDVRLVLRLNDQADFLTEFDEADLIALLRRIKYDGQLYVPWYLKANLSPPYKYLMHVIIKCFGNRTREQEEFDLKVLSFFAALVLNRKFNFSGWIFNYMKENILTKQVKSIMYPRFIQMILNDLHPNLPKNQNAILIMKHMNQIAVGKLPIYQKRKGNNVPPPVKRLIGHLANPDYIAPADGAAKHPDSSDDELEYNDNGYPIEIAENEEEIPEVQANQEPIQQQHVPVQQQQPEPVVHENIVEPEAVNLQDDDMTADADMSKGDDASASSSETDSDSGDYITILHNTREIPVKRGSKAHVAYLKSQTQDTSLYESRTKQVEDNDDDPLYTPVMEEPVAKSKPFLADARKSGQSPPGKKQKVQPQSSVPVQPTTQSVNVPSSSVSPAKKLIIRRSSTTASSSATASSTAAATRSTISSADLKLAIHQTRLDALESTNRQHADEIRGLQRVTDYIAPADGAAKHPDSSDDELEYNDNGYPIEIAENEEEIPEVQANQEPIQQQHVPVQQQQPEPVVHENIVEPEAVNLQDDDMTADADMSKGDDASASSSETDSDSGDYITILHNTREIPVKRGSKAHVAYLKSQTQDTSLYESRTKQVEDNDDDPLYTPVMEEPVAKSKPVDKCKAPMVASGKRFKRMARLNFSVKQGSFLADARKSGQSPPGKKQKVQPQSSVPVQPTTQSVNVQSSSVSPAKKLIIRRSSTTASSSVTASSTAAATRSTISSADLKLAIH
ncbi:hypothetical protein SSX86_024659 [Deinandra increscens subsp. villosa]|uniref:Reverse transcriptase Ty1/copia-type domain-containing protein n=1 Tax=Deinandra increscens subsp. villosa TaxID=3103831 RepID=A0AAP0CGF5_9ASTR